MTVTTKTTARVLIDTAKDVPVITWKDNLDGTMCRLFVRPAGNPGDDLYYKAVLRQANGGVEQWVPEWRIGRRSDESAMADVRDLIETALLRNSKTHYSPHEAVNALVEKREDTVHTCQGLENTEEVMSRDDMYALGKMLSKSGSVFKVTVVHSNGTDTAWLSHPFRTDQYSSLCNFISMAKVVNGVDRMFVTLLSGTPAALKYLNQYHLVVQQRPGTVIL